MKPQFQQDKQDYDPFQNPPTLKIAIRHRLANMVGVKTIQDSQVCPCCYKYINKKALDLRCHQGQLSFLGIGIILYFQIIKLASVLVGILFLMSISCWTIFHFTSCKQTCAFSIFSFAQTVMNSNSDDTILITCCGLLLLIILLIFTKRYYDRQAYSQQKKQSSPAYFTIKLQNLPPCEEDQLKLWMNNKFGQMPIAVHIVYDTNQLITAFSQRQMLTIKMLKNKINVACTNMNQSVSLVLDKSFLNKKNQLIQRIEEQDAILTKYKKIYPITPYRQTGVAFAVFQRYQKAKEIIQKYELTFQKRINRFFQNQQISLIFKQKEVRVNKAAYPKDIIWQNLSLQNYFAQTMINILSAIALLGLIGIIVIILNALVKIIYRGKDDLNMVILVVFIMYVLYHILLHVLISIFAGLRKQQTHTSRQINKFITYTYSNIIFPCLVLYSLNLDQDSLIFVANIFLFIDYLTHPFLKLFNFINIYRMIISEYINKLAPEDNPYTQDFFNRLMEGRDFQIGQNYHFILRSIFLSVYFAHLVPLSFLYALMSLILEYWTQKFLLLRKCKIPPKYSRCLSDRFLHMMGFLPAFYVLGVYHFQYNVRNQQMQNGWNFIALFIFAKVMTIILLVYFNSQSMNYHPSKIYSQIQGEFNEYYDLQNGIKKYNGQLKNIYRSFYNRQIAAIYPPTLQSDSNYPFYDYQNKSSQRSPDVRDTLIKKMLSSSTELLQLNKSQSKDGTMIDF